MSETIALVAVISALSGSILSTVKGFSQSGEKFKLGRLISSLIIGVFGSFTLINFGVVSSQLDTLGFVGLIITYLLLGFGADQGLSKLDK